MKLKILYINADTNETLREIELTEEETKALSLDIADIVEFHTNFIKQRVRQNIDKITEEAVKPQSKLLSDTDKKELIRLLLQKEIFVTRPRDLPDEIKRLIVKKADLSVLKPREEV
ncbi:MAG: hypothetical protein DRP29_00265 [Thermodesulfobacteriota bacterium]|nr:MAG: hypothetical protein DRP29_00265 [Thermodesulfobacteriota bacterium]